ncbi:hypothetical protein [Wolbachia endosymbiont of Trichogramma kaykai]|uniref:hypothetical protein n=1 Tax=Wolbachia endosymbiont of Trichogramma kaykai TaxID=444066 RepID=UPI0038916DB2
MKKNTSSSVNSVGSMMSVLLPVLDHSRSLYNLLKVSRDREKHSKLMKYLSLDHGYDSICLWRELESISSKTRSLSIKAADFHYLLSPSEKLKDVVEITIKDFLGSLSSFSAEAKALSKIICQSTPTARLSSCQKDLSLLLNEAVELIDSFLSKKKGIRNPVADVLPSSTEDSLEVNFTVKIRDTEGLKTGLNSLGTQGLDKIVVAFSTQSKLPDRKVVNLSDAVSCALHDRSYGRSASEGESLPVPLSSRTQFAVSIAQAADENLRSEAQSSSDIQLSSQKSRKKFRSTDHSRRDGEFSSRDSVRSPVRSRRDDRDSSKESFGSRGYSRRDGEFSSRDSVRSPVRSRRDDRDSSKESFGSRGYSRRDGEFSSRDSVRSPVRSRRDDRDSSKESFGSRGYSRRDGEFSSRESLRDKRGHYNYDQGGFVSQSLGFYNQSTSCGSLPLNLDYVSSFPHAAMSHGPVFPCPPSFPHAAMRYRHVFPRPPFAFGAPPIPSYHSLPNINRFSGSRAVSPAGFQLPSPRPMNRGSFSSSASSLRSTSDIVSSNVETLSSRLESVQVSQPQEIREVPR